MPTQIKFRSHSMKTVSVSPRRQLWYSSISPSRGGKYQATSCGFVGSEISVIRIPALKCVVATRFGLDLPGCMKQWVLWVPNLPRDKQKSPYGASSGASGLGKSPMISGLAGSLASITCTGLNGSRQSGSIASGSPMMMLLNCPLESIIGSTVW